MPVRVGRWWQELMHPCKYLKNNNWRTSRPFLTYPIDNKNNSQGLAIQRPSQSHQWSAIDTSARSVIHMRQLRQLRDYLKNNRARLLPPQKIIKTISIKIEGYNTKDTVELWQSTRNHQWKLKVEPQERVDIGPLERQSQQDTENSATRKRKWWQQRM